MEDVANLIPHPQNPNRHTESQIEALSKVIKHQGWRSPIVVSNQTGFVIAGHGRLEAAKVLNETKVPIEEQDFKNEADEFAHLVADNRIAELSNWDNLKLRDVISTLSDKELDLELTGFTQGELESLTAPVYDPITAPSFDSSEVTQGDVAQTASTLAGEYPKKVEELNRGITNVMCPKCGEEFAFSGV